MIASMDSVGRFGRWRRAAHGHFWTLGPYLAHAAFPGTVPAAAPWELAIDDALHGSVRLTGRLRVTSSTLVIVVHGLGGHVESGYVVRTARAAELLGLSCLRLGLRGSDGGGEDFYHAGLTSDLRAVLRSPDLAHFTSIVLVGWSLGGHLLLRWAAEPDRDPRVRSVAAICAPLDLEGAVRELQRPLGRAYQRYVLVALKQAYRAVAARRSTLPLSAAEVDRLGTLYEWDARVVVPRFGFASRDEYYGTMSAGPRLGDIAVRTLFLATREDPMVTAGPIEAWLPRASAAVEVVWLDRGGHVGFPKVDLGVGRAGAIEPQILDWALRSTPMDAQIG